MSKKFLVLVSLLSVCGFFSSGNLYGNSASFYLAIVQEGKRIEVHDMEKISIARSEFTLVFPLSNYGDEEGPGSSVYVTAFIHPIIFNIREGQSIDKISFFEPGSGFAGPGTGYEHLLLCSEGMHYLYYCMDDPAERRVEFIKELSAGRFEAGWTIKKVRYHTDPFDDFERSIMSQVVRGGLVNNSDITKLNPDKSEADKLNTFTLSEYPGNFIYLTVFSDLNLNRRADSGELIRAELNFR